MYRLGIDLGGTKIEGVVLERSGKEVFRKRIPTEQEKGYRHILDQLKAVHEILAGQTKKGAHTLGVGIPGTISAKTGLVKNANTVCLIGKPLQKDLEAILGRKLEMQNDANCFALAEAFEGAGKGKKMVFGVIMGTGCGGGIVYEGKVHAGLQGIAGEWGHMAIDPRAVECYCGRRGCVETFLSGGGLQKSFEIKYGRRLSLEQIVQQFRRGDAEAGEFMKAFFKNFGAALANLIAVLDPDIIVLGGGVSNIDELYTQGIEEVKKQIFSDRLETPIVKNRLGDSAGVLGAALIGI